MANIIFLEVVAVDVGSNSDSTITMGNHENF